MREKLGLRFIQATIKVDSIVHNLVCKKIGGNGERTQNDRKEEGKKEGKK